MPTQPDRGTDLHRRGWRLASTLLGLIFLGTSGVVLSGCVGFGLADGPPIPLADVDLGRMYGQWFLIATVANSFEKGMVAPYDIYSKRPDGDIREDFFTRHGGFDAPLRHFVVHDWVRPDTNNAHWRVRIFWPVDLPFLILYVDPSYRYVMFGEQNRQLGWIFARTQHIPDDDYRALLDRFRALGYDPTTFRKFVQTPDQIGQPGVWSDGISTVPAGHADTCGEPLSPADRIAMEGRLCQD